MITLIQRGFEDSFVLKEKTGKNKPNDQQDDVILLNTSKRMKYFLILYNTRLERIISGIIVRKLKAR